MPRVRADWRHRIRDPRRAPADVHLVLGVLESRVIANDLVWYIQTCRGGYGFGRRVPAVFLYARPRRVAVEVLCRDGSKKVIFVEPRNVEPRAAGESIE